jgi:radical SAM-linked protein
MIRLRLRFEKTGPLRFTSHLDMVRIFHRCFAARGIPVAYSHGFHPHPRVSVGPSLKTGWEGMNEYLDLYLEKEVEGIEEECNLFLPKGLVITGSAVMPEEAPKLSVDIVAARFEVELRKSLPADDEEHAQDLTPAGGEEEAEHVSKRENSDGELNPLAPFKLQAEYERLSEKRRGEFSAEILDLALSEGLHTSTMEYLTTMKGGKCLAPDEVLKDVVGDPHSFATPIKVRRKELLVKRGSSLIPPLS